MSGPLSSSLAAAFGLSAAAPVADAVPMREQVAAEAIEHGQRRAIARAGSRVYRTLSLPNEEEGGTGEFRAARARREQRDVATPSALIRRATQEWPDKCAKVAALAAQLGIPQGQTWLRVIEAGIMAIADDLAEEASG